MADQHDKPKRSFGDLFYDGLGMIFPSCGPALRMVELGQERPLTRKERFVLAYNSPLGLYCNCNRETFDKEREKFRQVDAERKSAK